VGKRLLNSLRRVAAYFVEGISGHMPATQRESTGRNFVFAVISAFVAGAFFYLTLCRFGYPVQSVEYVAHGLGLNPFPGIRHTLWSRLLTLFVEYPHGSLAFKANLLSAVLGAVSVGLMAYVMACIRHDRSREEQVIQSRHGSAGLISGGAAATFLTLSTPFWFISTRANPAALHAILILVPIVLLLRFQQTSRFFWLLLMAMVYGIGATEYAILYLLLPFFTAYVLVALSRTELLTVRRVLAISFSGLLGYSFVVFAAWQFVRTDAARWQGMDSLGEATFWFVKDQTLSLIKSIPGSGWLLISVMCVIPWFLIMGIPLKGEARRTTPVFGSIFLHAIVTILGILILFEVYVGPYEILGLSHLAVLPYVLAAMWFGYLAGYWFLVSTMNEHSGPDSQRPTGLFLRWLLPILLIVIFVGAGFRNFRVVNPAYGRAESGVANAIVDDLAGHEWILSQGLLDDSVLLEAANRGLQLRLINPEFAHLKPYARYYRSMFEEPKLRAIAEAGIVPLIAEWISLDRNLDQKLITLVNPDLWYQAGLDPVPQFASFAGTADIASEDLPARLEQQLRFWEETRSLLDSEVSAPQPIPVRNAWLRRYLSRIANNAGYALDQIGRSTEAESAYRSARALDSNNISALANLASIAQQNEATDADAVQDTLSKMIENPERPIHLRLVSHSYGYLRNPLELIAQGHIWAVSGFPLRSMSEIPRAIGGGTEQQEFMQLISTGDEEPQEKLEAGEKFYLAQLKKNPKDQGALFGLARNAVRRGDLDLARSTFLQLGKLGMSPPVVTTQLALVEMLAGDREACKDMLSEVVEQYPASQFPVCLLMFLALEDGNNYSVDRLAGKLKKFDQKRPVVYFTLAALSAHNPEIADPRENLEALTAFPGFAVSALERLMKLDLEEKRRNLLRDHVNRLLAVDPDHSFAHLALGKLQLRRGDIKLAETSFRKSIELDRTADGLNSLGWILTIRGRHEEALELADQAVKLTPDDPHIQDTRAIALMHLGRLEEAEAALRVAVELNPDWIAFQLHLVEVLEKQEKIESAVGILKALIAREDLTADQTEETATLERRLKNVPAPNH
jgi:Flp pilus assembly protein TadD